MRNEFGKFIVELAEKDDKVIVMVNDIGYGTFDEFIKRFPDRFFNFGICEQSMISAAAGMALEGLKPYVYAITPFLIERPFEQVKIDIDLQKVNVKLVGYADYPTQGPTHAEIDAPYMMKLFKNIQSYFPKNSEETRRALVESYESEKPTFISLKKDRNIEKQNKDLKHYLVKRISENESYESLLKFPRFLEVETINSCNANCPMCTINGWKNKGSRMTDELFAKIASEIIAHASSIKRVSLYRDGEPLLDPKLMDRIKMLKQGNVRDIAISTNVSLLTEKKAKELLKAGIDLVILSIDSLDKKIYEGIRVGLNFEAVMANALNFIDLRDKQRPEVKIWIRMIRQESNRDEWPSFHDFWSKKMSKNDRVYFHNIFNWGNQLDKFKPIAPSYEPNLPCVALWSLMVIRAQGEVQLCNVDYANSHPIGNVKDSSIEEIWQSKGLDEKRALHMKGQKACIDICNNCNVWDEPPDKKSISSEYADITYLEEGVVQR